MAEPRHEAELVTMRRWFALILVIAAFLVAPQSALAHSVLLSAQPAPGSRLAIAPGAVVLEFSEPLDPKLSTVTVTDPNGQRFTGGVTSSEEMRVSLTTNAPGVYTVQWASLSATDGHHASGSFEFGVQVSPGAPKVAQPPPLRLSDLFLAIARWAEALFLLVATGMLVVLWLASREPPLPWVLAPVQILPLALGAGFLVVWGEATLASGGPSLSGLLAYLTGSPAGIARVARLLFETMAVATAVWSGSRRWLAIWIGGALVALAASGHGASITPAWWGIGVDAVHLLAAGTWAGGILALSWQRPLDGWRSPQGHALLARFSPVALTAFTVTIGFGLIQATQELGSINALLVSNYGHVLLVKAALVASMIPLSLVAWRWRRPHFRIEAPLAAAVVGAAALLASFPVPPGQLPPSSGLVGHTGLPQAGDLTFGEQAGSFLVGLTLEPGGRGENRALVYLLPLNGARTAGSLRATISVNGAEAQQLTTCGTTCRQTTINLQGGETTTITVIGSGGGTATFSIPQLPAVDGAALLENAQRRMHRLRSYRLFETFTTGSAAFKTIADQYVFAAPDRMESTAVSGAQLVWIGPTQYTRNGPGQPWQVSSGVPIFIVPTFTWDYFRPLIDARIVGRSSVDGGRTTIVSFFGDTNGTPVWFRVWIDDTGLVRRAEMHAQGHDMHDVYSAFDGAPEIVPPK